MIRKTAELTGPALDWAVSRIEHPGHFVPDWHNYSTEWEKGGPIVEREGILLRPLRKDGHDMNGLWLAMLDDGNTGSMVQWVKRQDWPRHYLPGPAPLIAAMRCYVASKLGAEVDIPDGL